MAKLQACCRACAAANYEPARLPLCCLAVLSALPLIAAECCSHAGAVRDGGQAGDPGVLQQLAGCGALPRVNLTRYTGHVQGQRARAATQDSRMRQERSRTEARRTQPVTACAVHTQVALLWRYQQPATSFETLSCRTTCRSISTQVP